MVGRYRPLLLHQAGKYDAGVVDLLMLLLAAMSVFMTPVTVRLIERFDVRSVMNAGFLLAMASGVLLVPG